MAFREALNRWTAVHADTPADVDHMVGTIEVAIIGVLGPSGAGRKAYAGAGA